MGFRDLGVAEGFLNDTEVQFDAVALLAPVDHPTSVRLALPLAATPGSRKWNPNVPRRG
jgi:hypothetical protein